VGKVTHKLQVGGNDRLEVYEYPGGYAHHFDGVDKGGGERPDDLQKIFEDNRRLTKLRAQQEAAAGLTIRGAGNCRPFTSGHAFTLERHFNADGPYVLTAVEHTASLSGDFRSGEDVRLAYRNRFTCIPHALPYRPPPVTPRPRVEGPQTAVVVGPPGELVFCDKYGRVKVQFHWDRQGKRDENSSCWVRVGTPWAGKRRGLVHVPLVGDEVIVGFQEGDPDQPLILGSVYNAETMPPFELPTNRETSGFKGRTGSNFVKHVDTAGDELIHVHAEKNMTTEVKGPLSYTVVPNGRYQLHAQGQVYVTSDTEITLRVGGSHITITPSQIVIQSSLVKVNC
jgi:type VI secretion system secreted protein VgrG